MSDDVILQNTEGEDLTLWGAIRDLGFIFWLFTFVIGAPSILSLIQTVFVDFRFVDLLQWIIDGYSQLLDTLASVLEPIAIALFRQMKSLFGFDLSLRPHWQPLFIVLSIFISANTRSLWNDGYRETTFLFAFFMVIAALLGSWIAGVIPSNAVWWMQGLAAAAPTFLLFVGMWVAYGLASLIFTFPEGYRKPLASYLLRGCMLGISAFILAAVISFVRPTNTHSGVLVLFSGMFLYGAFWVFEGFRTRDVPEVRFGLRVVGGFLFAIVFLGLNLILSITTGNS
ncbi:MAG: hypothetical protein CMK09_04130 [Ponticaulis sp.]|nr:hypothetical protein [Ponticaulis sp.]|tara:strand:- start:28891 stop:29742 length:852 start_codon:yes stop_codon:yes gene_type:complete